ncbi:hypothetical protein [Lactobacillus panisapium]|uniref:Transposase n=1 Tax=Lactobacillus panisapium TaxID=2012495 RepID=A0ABX8W912_9LACO|nr:hypothetical protein [Lactobacillus panisapium]QYN53400.1 hypothetical protein GYM71_08190 [Lactobacillus panisapium]
MAQNNGYFFTVIGEWISGLNELRRYHSVSILNRELTKYGEQLENQRFIRLKQEHFQIQLMALATRLVSFQLFSWQVFCSF